MSLLSGTVVVIIMMMMQVFAEVVVVFPLLLPGVPPLMNALVAVLALLAQVFPGFGGFFAVATVLGDGLVELRFCLIGVVAAFRELIIGMSARYGRENHQGRGDHANQRGMLRARAAGIP